MSVLSFPFRSDSDESVADVKVALDRYGDWLTQALDLIADNDSSAALRVAHEAAARLRAPDGETRDAILDVHRLVMAELRAQYVATCGEKPLRVVR